MLVDPVLTNVRPLREHMRNEGFAPVAFAKRDKIRFQIRRAEHIRTMGQQFTGETLIVVKLKSIPLAHEPRPSLLLHLWLVYPRQKLIPEFLRSEIPAIVFA